MSEPEGKMLKQMAKATVVAVASAVAIPYSLAIFTNMVYGWPRGPDRYALTAIQLTVNTFYGLMAQNP